MSVDTTKLITEVMEEATKTAQNIVKRMAIIERLRELGLAVTANDWALRYGHSLDVKKKDLPAVRKVCGRLTVTGKTAAWNFDSTNELVVTVEPVNKKDFPVSFSYRAKFRKGGKCEVRETVQPARVSKTLVCRK